MSVIPPKPVPKIASAASSGVFDTMSSSAPSRTKADLFSFSSKWYIEPLLMSPTNISFSYSSPSALELRNSRAVGSTGSVHVNSGLL